MSTWRLFSRRTRSERVPVINLILFPRSLPLSLSQSRRRHQQPAITGTSRSPLRRSRSVHSLDVKRASARLSSLCSDHDRLTPSCTFFDLPQFQSYAVVTTTIRLWFDGRSTAYQRSFWSQWRNPLAAVTRTYLFISLSRNAAAQAYGHIIIT